MFYLGTILKAFGHFKMRSFLFFITTVIFISCYLGANEVNRQVGKIAKPYDSRVFFNVLLDENAHIESITDKIAGLPGVDSVDLKDHRQLQENLSKGLNSLDIILPKSMSKNHYQAFSVFLNKGVSERSKRIIKEYVQKVAPHEILAVGPLVVPKNQVQTQANSPLKTFFSHWGSFIILGFICILWVISSLSFVTSYRRYCYLVEQFQRKKNVASKSIGVFFFTLFFIIGLVIASLSSLNIYAMLFLLIFLASYSWTMSSQWRWNQDQ